MPVSRKRKKKDKSGGRVVRTGRSIRPEDTGLVDARRGLAEFHRVRDERRAALARAAAEDICAALADIADESSDPAIEDALCVRCGAALWETSKSPIDDRFKPDHLADALVDASAQAVREGLDGGAEAERWRAAWRVLVAVSRIVPEPWRTRVEETAASLRQGAQGGLLPVLPDGPAVTGPVRWVRDVYGSRLGVVAPVSALDGADRWYLWDVDACGMKAFNVYSGLFATAEEALAEWRAGVGSVAAGSAELRPVDDPELLAALLPTEEGILWVGGENAGQFAEYHRSRRMAEIALSVAGPVETAADVLGPSGTPERIDARQVAGEDFVAWLNEHRSDQPRPGDFEELVEALATAWSSWGPAALFRACSPHRVAETAVLLEDFYEKDYAARVGALLPDWTTWLARCNGTPPELADRCLPYVTGAAYPGTDGRNNPLARVVE